MEPLEAFQVRLPQTIAAKVRALVAAEDAAARAKGHTASLNGVLARVVTAWAEGAGER